MSHNPTRPNQQVISPKDLVRLEKENLVSLLESEIDKINFEDMKEALIKARWVLQPFSDCVQNDNGELTVSVTDRVTSRQTIIDAYFVYQKINKLLKEI